MNIDHNAYSTDLINKKDTKIMASEHLVVLRAVEARNVALLEYLKEDFERPLHLVVRMRTEFQWKFCDAGIGRII